jgi:microcin C transport system permease protein
MTEARVKDRWFGIRITPIMRRRIGNFRRNRRALWSLRIFGVLFLVCLFAEFIANDRPAFIWFDGAPYFPAVVTYNETEFGGDFPTEADYRDEYVKGLIEEKGWIIWPPIRFSYDTVNLDLPSPAPSPPDEVNWLGTDDQARDVAARLIYGFRLSVLFGFSLTIISSILGILAGAVQGYFGGWLDLIFQRVIEIWASMPSFQILIILSAVLVPGFWTLLIALTVFSWMGLTGLVRAEFFRGRNFTYVRAARALGVSDWAIMIRHLLPNAMVATLTFLPFILSGSLVALTGLDLLGLGLPPGSPSLGELLAQGKANLQAPWLGITAFVVISALLVLLVFIGEGVRDAFDPRKIYG